MSTMPYSAESWPLSVTRKKKLEAAHHKFQRRILGIIWKDILRMDDDTPDCRGKLNIGIWTQQSGKVEDQGKAGTKLYVRTKKPWV